MAGHVVRPIGEVRNDIKERGWQEWHDVVSEIHLDSRYAQGIKGLSDFSHIIVLCWMHQLDEPRNTLQVHPQRRPDLPLVGVFATRAPVRPNPLGVTVVELLEQEGAVLKVLGLDVIDGTPVLDIKPFIPERFDMTKVRTPDWINKLRHRQAEN
ncbi:MAG: tRNA (N6-threonylcarbamoyladenosine(37)-N6)-methyltransferase TrmO [Dehalococcoidia bacterium]|nr:tRNA (N6-threonylcarbamoyladenosine(37)-N6)-methyltransferase TrmO [Dehalococcoidia bacterium]